MRLRLIHRAWGRRGVSETGHQSAHRGRIPGLGRQRIIVDHCHEKPEHCEYSWHNFPIVGSLPPEPETAVECGFPFGQFRKETRIDGLAGTFI